VIRSEEPVQEELSDNISDSENEEESSKKEKYYKAIGRRKESVAIIRLYTKKSSDAVDEDKALSK